MAVYNSQIGSLEDDSDISIINPSMNDEYVDNTQTTNPASNNNSGCPSGVGTNEYIFVEHDLLERAKELEQVLIFYIRDLKKKSNTQLECDKQLVTRIMDLIRPAYLNDQQKMIQLDKIVEEIGLLHDERHIEEKDKIEQLRADRNRLHRMMFPASNDETIHNDQTKNHSMFSTLQHQGYPSTDYEQWTEIEDDAKRLHELVESQRNQINEIVSLISQTAAASVSIDPPNVPTGNTKDATTDKQLPPTPNTNMINDLFRRVQVIAGLSAQQQKQQQQLQTPVITAPVPNTTLINHSPGASPTQSLNTLTLSTMTPTIIDPKPEEPEIPVYKEELKTPVDKGEPVVEKPHEPIDIPVPPPAPISSIDIPVSPPPAPISPIEVKKCPVCSHEFPPTSDDVEMYDHIEKCLFPSGAAVEPKDYECPNCARKFPGNDDSTYLQHLSDCYNQAF
jgi:hypothetical protein